MNAPLRVLMVEDRENDALLVLRELRRSGYDPDFKRVATRQGFLSLLQQQVWDIVLADYSLPQYSGLEALHAVRELVPDLPFVVVSGTIGEEVAVAAMRAGADDFVLKHSLSRLGPVVDRELRDSAMRRARRVAEQKLQERDALFRSIIENVSDLVVILNREGKIRYHSPSVGRLLGYAPEELIGKCAVASLRPDQRELALEALQNPDEHLRSSPLISCEVKHKDDGWRILEGTATNLLADPIVRGIVCNFRDVTQQRQEQRQIARAQRMESLGNLAGGIAHDLNNMLTPILIAGEMLQEDLSKDDRRALLEGLNTGAHRAADVVQQLLSFARGMRNEEETAQVADLVRETERLLRFGLPKSISITTSLPQSLWSAAINPTELTQVLINLCVNARDAMQAQGGRLTLSAANVVLAADDLGTFSDAKPGKYVVVNVVDTGKGIPRDIQERIYDPFFTTKGKQGGTGLGLSTTASIVQEHNGFIRLYSEVGQGTRFAVYLPANVPVDMAEPHDRTLPTGSGEWVLAIVDQAGIREIVREMLEAHNYQVVTAADGAVGVVLYRDHAVAFDVVIVDLTLPPMNAEGTISAIRRLNPKARILLQSGLVSDRDQAADAFLEKPYTTGELLQSVHDLLQRKTT